MRTLFDYNALDFRKRINKIAKPVVLLVAFVVVIAVVVVVLNLAYQWL